jgi:hypothetical protein
VGGGFYLFKGRRNTRRRHTAPSGGALGAPREGLWGPGTQAGGLGLEGCLEGVWIGLKG